MSCCFFSTCSTRRSSSTSNLEMSMVGTNRGASVKRYLISSRGRLAVSGSRAQKKTALVKLQTWEKKDAPC